MDWPGRIVQVGKKGGRMSARRFTPWLVLLLVTITFFGLLDLAFDFAIEAPTIHLVGEVVFLGLTLLMAISLGVGWFLSRRTMTRMRAATTRAQVFMEGLGKAIKMQLAEWGLSEGESTTALLMLKGMSHKHIAAATGRSESTVRQHAVEIYRKSGLSGRAELSAFFLEDLLLPNPLENNNGVGAESTPDTADPQADKVASSSRAAANRAKRATTP
jgi:DNA-binding CsgD family transcriptional regulator